MIETTTLITWLGVCNVLCACLLFLAFFRIESTPLRYSFLAVVATGMLYFNPLILFWMPDLSDDTRLFLSRLVFTGVLTLANAFVIFVIQFCQTQDELKKIPFTIFQASVVGLISFVWTGYLPLGVAMKNGEIVLVHGFAHVAFVACTSSYMVYIIYLAWSGYRKTQEELIQFQIKMVLGTGVIITCVMVLTNSILPFILKRSFFAPIAAIELLAFWSVALYVLVYGELLLLRRDFNSLLKKPFMREMNTLFGLRTYIYAFETAMEVVRPLDEKIPLKSMGGRDLQLFVSNRDSGGTRTVDTIPAGWYEGQLDEVERLRRENLRLTLEIERGRRIVIASRNGDPDAIAERISAEETKPMIGLTPLEDAERRTIIQVLQKYSYNQARASRELGIRPNTMIVKMRKYGIERPPRT